MSKREPSSQEPKEPALLEKLLTTQDIADMLQLSVVKVYRLINLSGLPSIKIDGSRRFRPSEVQKWLEQHTQAS
ncbi:MAG TPA: helix-turn-helix domain-containing protein [Ktedonobacteraceae bacterium]|nr:helix-turn-helix domain-containing protein [Ktedonobacteraceae bacterium]